MGESKDTPHLAARAALLTRAAKRDIDRREFRQSWERQASELGFSAAPVRKHARPTCSPAPPGTRPTRCPERSPVWPKARRCSAMPIYWRRPSPASLARSRSMPPNEPYRRSNGTAGFSRAGPRSWPALDDGRGDGAGIRDDRADACGPWHGEDHHAALGRGEEAAEGCLNEGQKEAVKTILSSTDWVISVQGYAGTGKTTMLKRLHALAES